LVVICGICDGRTGLVRSAFAFWRFAAMRQGAKIMAAQIVAGKISIQIDGGGQSQQLTALHHRDAALFHRQRQFAMFERERFLAE
jgi:hypothetical protein